METKRHNGWTNYETWCAFTWLANDESSQSHFEKLAAEIFNRHSDDFDDAVIAMADCLKFEIADSCPSLEAGLYADLLQSAMAEIDLREIATHYIDDAQQAY